MTTVVTVTPWYRRRPMIIVVAGILFLALLWIVGAISFNAGSKAEANSTPTAVAPLAAQQQAAPTATADPMLAELQKLNANLVAGNKVNADQGQQIAALTSKVDQLMSQPTAAAPTPVPVQPTVAVPPSPEPTAQPTEETVTFPLEKGDKGTATSAITADYKGEASVQSGQGQTYDPFNVQMPSDAHQYNGDGGTFWVQGGVDVATNNATASGQFVNKMGLGTQSFLAEPGKLLVDGWDFDLTALKNSGGAIDTWNPTSQAIFGWLPPAFWNLNEGGFNLLVANRMTVAIPDRATFHVEGDESTAWIIILRGLYTDSSTPKDRNLNVVVRDYVPGNIMAARYSGTPNGGFISEGQFAQIADSTQKGSNDCGQSGCPKLYALMYDANTGGWTVIERDGPNAGWSLVQSNMDYLK